MEWEERKENKTEEERRTDWEDGRKQDEEMGSWKMWMWKYT